MVDLLLTDRVLVSAPGSLSHQQVKPVAQQQVFPSTGAGDPIPPVGPAHQMTLLRVPLPRGHSLFHLEWVPDTFTLHDLFHTHHMSAILDSTLLEWWLGLHISHQLNSLHEPSGSLLLLFSLPFPTSLFSRMKNTAKYMKMFWGGWNMKLPFSFFLSLFLNKEQEPSEGLVKVISYWLGPGANRMVNFKTCSSKVWMATPSMAVIPMLVKFQSQNKTLGNNRVFFYQVW